jgi:hypothetical protein
MVKVVDQSEQETSFIELHAVPPGVDGAVEEREQLMIPGLYRVLPNVVCVPADPLD